MKGIWRGRVLPSDAKSVVRRVLSPAEVTGGHLKSQQVFTGTANMVVLTHSSCCCPDALVCSHDETAGK